MSECEVWKPIKGYEGLYEVSNHGRVRSLNRTTETRNRHGEHKRKYKGRILSTSKRTEYELIWLYKDGAKTRAKVHRIVASTFVANEEQKPFVNHIDLDKHNNRADNLEWVTNKENIQHAIDNGRTTGARGENHGNVKITEDIVRWIRINAKVNGGLLTLTEMSKETGVSKQSCSMIAKRQRWKHIE